MQSATCTKTSIMLLMLLLSAAFTFSSPTGLRKTPAQDLIESIPKEDRGAFVAFHLSGALNNDAGVPRYTSRLPTGARIPHDKYEKFKGVATFPQFRSHLLHWTKATFNMTNTDVYKMVTTFSSVCFPNGCFDPNDVGAMCCPF